MTFNLCGAAQKNNRNCLIKIAKKKEKEEERKKHRDGKSTEATNVTLTVAELFTVPFCKINNGYAWIVSSILSAIWMGKC